MSPKERVEHITHYKAFLGLDQERRERTKERWQRIWFSPGNGKGLPLGQEFGDHFLSPALSTAQCAPEIVPG